MNRVLILPLFLLFLSVGCATQFQTVSKTCRTKATWHQKDKHKDYFDFTIEKWFLAPLGQWVPHEVHIEDVLAIKNINCDQIESFTVTSERKWYDALVSWTPFFASHRVIFHGKFKSAQNDELAHTNLSNLQDSQIMEDTLGQEPANSLNHED